MAVEDNLLVHRPETSRRRLARTLSAAYADGLLSEDTFARRLDELLQGRLICPTRLTGDLALRHSGRGRLARAHMIASAVFKRIGHLVGDDSTLLALDWSGKQEQLVVGRDSTCDVVLVAPTVSRRHARLVFRSGTWIVQDLESTNGTVLNGAPIGRSELRPGDRLLLGEVALRVD